MSEASTIPDPFRCYIGTRVSRGRRQYVVVDHRVQNRHLLFCLRDVDGGHDELVTLLELLELLERQDR